MLSGAAEVEAAATTSAKEVTVCGLEVGLEVLKDMLEAGPPAS